MDNMTPEKKEKFHKAIRIALIVFIAVIVANIVSGSLRYNENYNDNKPVNTISMSGHGEVSAVPDIANVYFTIRKEAKTVKEAQDNVAQVEKKVLDFLKANNIADADRKAENIAFNPKYDYQYSMGGKMFPCTLSSTYPCPGQNVIVGYEAYESITVKVRNVDDVGKIVAGLGTLGATDMNGPNFAIDNEDALKAKAQKLAIDDARAKAEVLAENLGVRLGKITSFSDNGNNYPVPMYEKAMTTGVAPNSAPLVAQVPTGENTITSDVTITYEIR